MTYIRTHSIPHDFTCAFARGLVLFLAAVFFAFSSAQAAGTTPTDDMRLSYDLYAGGLHALNATMDMSIKDDSYIIDVEAEVRGFMRHILPWKGSLISKGKKEPGGRAFVPQTHERISAWPDEVKRTILEYDNEGQLLVSRAVIVEDDKVTKYPNDMDKNAARDAVDLLTATMHMMVTSDESKVCNQSIPVYDGKRRYDLVLKKKGTEQLKTSRYNNFQGKAIRCSFELDMKSAEDRKKNHFFKAQEKSKAQGREPTVWLGKIRPHGLYVPVKALIKSDYGSLMIHLTGATTPERQHASSQ